MRQLNDVDTNHRDRSILYGTNSEQALFGGTTRLGRSHKIFSKARSTKFFSKVRVVSQNILNFAELICVVDCDFNKFDIVRFDQPCLIDHTKLQIKLILI